MKIIVQLQRSGNYKLLFYDGKSVRGAAYVELNGYPPRPPAHEIPGEVGCPRKITCTLPQRN